MKKQLTFCLTLLTILCTSTHAQLPSYLPADGLVGWWPFNGNANDESGNGNHGVVNGAVLTEDRFGAVDSAYDFNGTALIAVAVPTFTFTEIQDFSVSCYVYFTTEMVSTQLVIYGNLIPDNYGWHIGLYNTLVQWGVARQQSSWSQTNIPRNDVFPNLNSWYHVLGVKSNGVISLYIDGILVGAVDQLLQGATANNLPLNFGGWQSDAAYYLQGKLDDIAIWNRALTEQEIQNLYTATNTGNTTDTGNGAAPLPQGIPYQAAARDGNGQPVVNSPVTVRFSLHEGAADGAASYIESHSLTTNSIGLFNTVFGNGTPEQSAFDSINWAATTKFLQVEVDLGNGYVDMGTTQLLSVPYAFRSAQAANIKNAALPVYSDNAAALAGGLVAGEMYRTTAGVLMIAY